MHSRPGAFLAVQAVCVSVQCLRRVISRTAPTIASALQIIHEADKIYGVSHSNRISRVDVVTREDALEFVQANLQENEDAQGNENRDPN